jgi:ABC-type transport system substrate-binding protein
VGVPWARLIQGYFPDQEVQITVLAQGQEFGLAYDVEYDPDKARALLEEAGFSGFQLLLLFISDDEASFPDIAEEIGWYLGEIGIMVVGPVPVEADRVHDAMAEIISANETILWLGWQGTVPTPPPSIVTQGTIQLVDGQSFDFLTGDVGEITGGDLYVLLSPAGGCDDQDSFWANNSPQRGGVDLGEFSESDLSLIQAPPLESTYDCSCVPIEWNHVYAYLQNQQGLVVIFRVLDHQERQSVYLEYVVIKGP